jgi:hypothetical protein
MPEDVGTGRDAGTARDPERFPLVWLVLAIPVLLLIYPPLYNHTDPELFGIPFFYWYQLATVPIAVTCTSAVFVITRRPR